MRTRSGSSSNLGHQARLYAEVQPTADETQFQLDNTSDRYYKSAYYELHKDQLQPVPAPRTSPPRMDLAGVLGSDATAAIAAAKKISFHSVGDTGRRRSTTSRRRSRRLRTRPAWPTRWRGTSGRAGPTPPPSSSTSATSSTTSAR